MNQVADLTPPHASHTAGALILIVEDEARIATIIARYLEAAGYRTVSAPDGEQALALCETLRPDLLVLDLNIPKRDGFQVLGQLRARDQTPVIVVSALSDDDDKLAALRIGADDYVTKPFNPREIVARVEAVLRRRMPAPEAVMAAGNVVMDPTARRVEVRGTDCGVTESEFRLLGVMMRQPGRAFSRGDLLDAALEHSDASERVIDSHISNLRRKLIACGASVAIRGVRGYGYRLDPR